MTTDDAVKTQDVATGAPPSQDPPDPTWQKARLPSLVPSTTAEEALADIVHGCVEHLRSNTACVMARAHEEGIHQMRVAVRRLRSCLALYAPFLPVDQHKYLVGELKWLIGELGPARDWDVFVGEILKPVLIQLGDEEDRLSELSLHVEKQRDNAYARAQTAVSAQRYRGLVLLLSSWAEGRGWRDPSCEGQHAALAVSATHIAHELLDAIYQDLLAAGAGFEHLAPAARHKVRIQLKKLRYATEFFSSLYPKRKVTPYLTAMKALQDDLGANNDVDVAKTLLRRALKGTRGKQRTRLSYAAGMVVGWHGHIGDGREQQVIAAWNRLTGRAPYWETQAAVTQAAQTQGGGNPPDAPTATADIETADIASAEPPQTKAASVTSAQEPEAMRSDSVSSPPVTARRRPPARSAQNR